MAKQVTQLNQTAERIVQLLDTVDEAISSSNDTLFWTTKTTDGVTTLTPIAIGRVVEALPESGESHLDYFVKQDYVINEEQRFTYIHYKWIEGKMIAINDVDYYSTESLKAFLESNEYLTLANLPSIVENIQTNVDTLIDFKTVTEAEIENLKTSLNKFSYSNYDLTYKDDILSFIKYDLDGNPIEDETVSFKIVSAGEATVSSEVTVNRKTPSEFSTTLENPQIVEYTVRAVDQDGASTAPITVTWRINNVVVLTETLQSNGDYTFALKNRVSAGTNVIKATFKDNYGTTKTVGWTANIIDVKLTSAFDDTITYSRDVVLNYVAYGNISKEVHFILDGKEIGTQTITTSGISNSFTIPYQEHGAHTVKIYATAIMPDGTEVRSEDLFYDIMFIDADSTQPVIRWAYDDELALEQYETTSFKYSIYTPNQLTSNVQLLINDEVVTSLTVDRLEQTWNYKPMEYGEVKFSIVVGEVRRDKVLTINKFPYDVSPVTANLQLDFNPLGRTNNDADYQTFTYTGQGGYTTTMTVSEGFDWDNGGWQTDSEGNSYFCVKAGDRMILDYPLFDELNDKINSTMTYGKNFKLTYKAVNCREMKAPVMKCLHSTTSMVENEETGEMEEVIISTGIDMNAQDAIIYAGGGKLEIPYCEDERIGLEVNIQKYSTKSEDIDNNANQMLVYIDSDPSRMTLYSTPSALSQQVVQPITFGSDTCDVHIYRFKAYDAALSDEDILANHIAEAPNAEEMIARFERNNFMKDGEIDVTTLSQLYPDLRILLVTCPRFTNDKNDKIEGCTVQHIMGNGDPRHNWTAGNVRIKGQGTSSNAYGTAGRNLDFKMSAVSDDVDDHFVFEDGTIAKKYGMTSPDPENGIPGSVPVNYFNIKVNIASSEGANNARLAERFNKYNPFTRAAKKNDPRVRDTMEFHPCVIFVKELGTSPEGNQEFAPEDNPKFHFYACGDFGNSKKNSEAMGMDSKNLKECIVEVSNNTEAGCLFRTAPGWSEILPDEYPGDPDKDVWEGDVVEFRHPEDIYDRMDPEEYDIEDYTDKGMTEEEALAKIAEEVEAAKEQFAMLKAQTRRLWNWVESCDVVGLDPVNDAAEIARRQKKFVDEYEQYFESDSLLFQYLFTERHLMVDNRAKNVFLHTIDGLKWDFCFDYDNDTSEGCDNVGDLKYRYGLEDIDLNDEGFPVFNAADSALWVNVRQALYSKLKEKYGEWESLGTWSSASVIADFDNYQWNKPERLHMIDMRRKYIRPYTEGHYRSNITDKGDASISIRETKYMNMLNGRKTYQRRRFEKNQEKYLAAKYFTPSIKADDISFRAWTKTTEHEDIVLKPYADTYITVDFDNSVQTLRCKAGEGAHFKWPATILQDKNTNIYPASLIEDAGDLSDLYVGGQTFSVARATRLTKLQLGSGREGYQNANLKTFALNSAMLKYLDLRGCSGLNIAIDLSGCVNLEEIYTKGTNITGVTFANGGLLKYAELNAIGSLTARNLRQLETLTLSSYGLLGQLSVENVPTLTSLSFLKTLNNLTALRAIGVDWNALTASEITPYLYKSGITETGGLTATSVVAGNAYIETLREADLNEMNTKWPNLNVTYNEDKFIKTHQVTYKNANGNILGIDNIDNNTTPGTPVGKSMLGPDGKPVVLETPTLEQTDSTIYTFDGWVREDRPDSTPEMEISYRITAPATFIAHYSTQTRTYNVTWMNGSDELYSTTVLYGSEALYQGVELGIEAETGLVRIFKGWDNSTGYIMGDTKVRAVWEEGQLPDVPDPDARPYESTLGYKAADLLTILSTPETANTKRDQYLAAGDDPIMIHMGNRLEFGNIEHIDLVSSPRLFTTSTPLNTEYYLVNNINNGWTLMLDYELTGTAQQTLVTCGQSSANIGLSIIANNGTVTIYWNGISRQFNQPINQREILVLNHRPGETKLSVYRGGCYEDETPKVQTLDKEVFGTSTRNALSFTPTHAIFYNSRLYPQVLSSKELSLLSSWVWEDLIFNCVSTDNYYNNNVDTDWSFDFFCASAIVKSLGTTSKSNATFDFSFTDAYTWLNNRFYYGLPKQWQLAIKEAKYYASSGTYNGDTIKVDEVKQLSSKIFTPSLKELGFDISNDSYYGTLSPTAGLIGAKSLFQVYNTNYADPRLMAYAYSMPRLLGDTKWEDLPTERASQPINGSIWVDVDSQDIKIYNGLQWYSTKSLSLFTRDVTLLDNTLRLRSYYPTLSFSSSILKSVSFSSPSWTSNNTTYTGLIPCFSVIWTRPE